jgi:hypothetical protein
MWVSSSPVSLDGAALLWFCSSFAFVLLWLSAGWPAASDIWYVIHKLKQVLASYNSGDAGGSCVLGFHLWNNAYWPRSTLSAAIVGQGGVW